VVSLVLYAVAFTLYQLAPEQTFTNPASVILWVFIVCTKARSVLLLRSSACVSVPDMKRTPVVVPRNIDYLKRPNRAAPIDPVHSFSGPSCGDNSPNSPRA
jgi:hypothetical protein